MGNGFTIAGNLIVDYVKDIDAYPEEGQLCNIFNISRAIGGCASNTAVNIATMDPDIQVKSVGLVGEDENGDFIIQQLSGLGVNTSLINKSPYPTSFTDVMSVAKNQRTFFHARGANAHFSDLPEEALDCRMLHMGYALLLDKMDEPDSEFGTRMARILARARSKGVKTSMDVVSEVGNRFKKIVQPSLKHCDYLIINENEASRIAEIPVRTDNGEIIFQNIVAAMQCLLDMGVHELVVIHAPEGGWGLKREQEIEFTPSLKLPEGYIQGTVGAGDAFCAGILYSIYMQEPLRNALRFAVAAAACNLSKPDSISGIKKAHDIWKVFERYSDG
jgi:sugar/nucleoside kinase (ribokinase family)